MESREYYEARQRAERTAADEAASPEAQMAHDELARAYSKVAEDSEPKEQQPDA